MGHGPRFLRSFAWNHAARLVDFGLLYLVRVLVARALGPQHDSVYALFANLLTFPVLLTAFGTDWVVLKHVPPTLAAGEHDRVASILRRTFVARVLASAIGGALVSALLGLGMAEGSRWGVLAPYAGFAVVFVIGQNLMQFGMAANTALHRTRTLFMVNTAVRGSLFIGLLVIIAVGQLTPGAAIAAVSIAAAVGAIAYSSGLRTRMRGTAVNVALRPMLAYGAALLGQDVLSLVLGRWSDIIIISYWFPGGTSVSMYDNGFQFGMMVQLAVTVGLGGVLFSTFAEMAAHARENMAGALSRVLQIVQLVFFPFAAFVIVIAPSLVGVVYGQAYAAVTMFVQVYVAIDCIVVGVFGGGNCALALNTIGQQNFVVRNRMSWGIVNIALNLAVIPAYGPLAALACTRLCVAGAECVEFINVRRKIGRFWNARALEAPLLIAVVAGVLSWALAPVGLAGIAVAGAIFLGVGAAVVALMRPPAFTRMIEAARGRMGGTA
jgi:O-antigen/teichoic acid export membrane protein